jgi:hypothetical protein
LNRVIESKRLEEATAKRDHSAATKAAARDSWRREKAGAVTAMSQNV